MADIFSPDARSRIMKGIRSRDTKPEFAVRRILRGLGVGYRLHASDLPGCPDIVMKGRRKIIDVRAVFGTSMKDAQTHAYPRPASIIGQESSSGLRRETGRRCGS